MNRRLLILFCATVLLSGCQSLQKFMSRDLEDEDFVIGQLYVDEVVRETPVIARRVATPKEKESGKTNALGLAYSPDDNAALYVMLTSSVARNSERAIFYSLPTVRVRCRTWVSISRTICSPIPLPPME